MDSKLVVWLILVKLVSSFCPADLERVSAPTADDAKGQSGEETVYIYSLDPSRKTLGTAKIQCSLIGVVTTS